MLVYYASVSSHPNFSPQWANVVGVSYFTTPLDPLDELLPNTFHCGDASVHCHNWESYRPMAGYLRALAP
jgi:hypothetical protein